MKRLIFVITLLIPFVSHAAKEEIESPSPPEIGNFAHTFSPFSTFAFGQNIFVKNTFLFYPSLFQCAGKNFTSIELTPAVLYSPTDSFSVYAGLPIVLKDTSDGVTQRGIGDFFFQCEYALIDHSTTHAENMLTIVGNVAAPTTHLSTSDCIQTTTNYAATSFFLGTTMCRISVQSYMYASLGATLHTKKHDVRSGANILYEAGVGLNIASTNKVTIVGLLECNGEYSLKDSVDHCKDPDTGGNIIYLGPTLSLTSNRWVVTGGIQIPVVQHLNGTQDKTRYRTSLQVALGF